MLIILYICFHSRHSEVNDVGLNRAHTSLLFAYLIDNVSFVSSWLYDFIYNLVQLYILNGAESNDRYL